MNQNNFESLTIEQRIALMEHSLKIEERNLKIVEHPIFATYALFTGAKKEREKEIKDTKELISKMKQTIHEAKQFLKETNE